MSTLARALFAALVIATFGAFFVAQRLKSSEPRISHLGVEGLLSPNQDGRRESVKPVAGDTRNRLHHKVYTIDERAAIG